jgi:hypothetical protein
MDRGFINQGQSGPVVCGLQLAWPRLCLLCWQLEMAKTQLETTQKYEKTTQPVDNWTTTTRQQTTRRAELNTLSKQCDSGESDLGESV